MSEQKPVTKVPDGHTPFYTLGSQGDIRVEHVRIIARSAGLAVIAAAAGQGVVAAAAVEVVEAVVLAADQGVRTRSAEQLVAARAAVEQVIAVMTFQPVVAGIAPERIAADVADQQVIPGAAGLRDCSTCQGPMRARVACRVAGVSSMPHLVQGAALDSRSLTVPQNGHNRRAGGNAAPAALAVSD